MEKEIAVFGNGCFWCTEAVFKMLKGITLVAPGYAGGQTLNPTYEHVATGETGHAEVIRIEFDPSEISYHDLLTVFFATHDATQLNRQGNDVGTQYRSIILYVNETQKEAAQKYVDDLNASTRDGKRVVTHVEPLTEFYPAEEYHKEYYSNHTGAAYCQLVIAPKLEKAQKAFAELLKTHSA